LRIIKSNKAYYKSFAETLVESPAMNDNSQPTDYHIRKTRDRDRKLARFMESLVDYDLALHHSDNLENVVSIVKNKSESVIDLKELAFFYFDEGYDDFTPVTNGYAKAFGEIVQAIKKDSLFDSLISRDKMILIPISESLKIRERLNNILFIPIKKWKMNKYFVCIDTPVKSLDEESYEGKALMIILAHAVPIIENIHSRVKLFKVYRDFQIYQSKFLKDYRLAVVGELTLGMAEEIISPMQVILSSIEFIAENNKDVDPKLHETIGRQIKKVKTVVKRLVKFSSLASSDIEIKPVDINNIIKDYVDVMNVSMKAQNFECITDLAKQLPAILSHRSYINLMLSAIFTLVRKDDSQGGVILQSRVNDNYVFIKALTTNFVEEFSPNDVIENQSLELLILENLVKKHEGRFLVKAKENEGSKLIIALPIIRKIRK